MTITNIIKIIIVFILNIFIVSFVFEDTTFVSVSRRMGNPIIKILFLYLFFSFDDNDAVYINNVIIPDENVRIVTNPIHLDKDALNNKNAVIKDSTKIEIAIVIGFEFFDE